MDHPLRSEGAKALRARMVQFLKEAFSVTRSGNIVFVCGANGDDSLRMQFLSYAKAQMSDYDLFFPEFAMDDYFSADVQEPFDIADFEEIIAAISHAIVLFPEGPGSFAETGYFAAKAALAGKSLLVLDSDRQSQDSFISMGPAKIIGENSKFNPVMYLKYSDPNFHDIKNRLMRHKVSKHRKTLALSDFKYLSNYELLSLIHKICAILSICTIEDIEFFLRSIFSSQISSPLTRKLTSILVGAKYLVRIGEYGHVHVSTEKSSFLKTRDGYLTEESELRIELAALYESGDQEFASIVEASRSAN